MSTDIEQQNYSSATNTQNTVEMNCVNSELSYRLPDSVKELYRRYPSSLKDREAVRQRNMTALAEWLRDEKKLPAVDSNSAI